MGSFGIKFMLFVSIGFSKFKVAGRILFFMDNIEKIDSTLPAAPSRCPIDDFVELTQMLFLNNFEIALSSISSPLTVDVP